ncbi:MAG: GntR family transcriptional regulator [Actinomycetota bacterium]|nr:GntR family transcriptional regulator [Actinomycetota bacterium]
MTSALQRGNGLSLGEQIRLRILGRITDGTYGRGERLPTERDLAGEFAVSLAPVRTALAALASSGHVRRIQGSGTFVSEAPLAIEIALFPSLTQVLRKQEVPFEMTGVRVTVVPTPDVAAAWFPRAPERVVWLERVITVHGNPVAALDAWLPSPTYDGLRDHDFADGSSLYSELLEHYGIRPVDRDGILSVVAADAPAAEDLLVPLGSPVVQVMRSTALPEDPDDVVEVSRVHYEPSVFSFRLRG